MIFLRATKNLKMFYFTGPEIVLKDVIQFQVGYRKSKANGSTFVKNGLYRRTEQYTKISFLLSVKQIFSET